VFSATGSVLLSALVNIIIACIHDPNPKSNAPRTMIQRESWANFNISIPISIAIIIIIIIIFLLVTVVRFALGALAQSQKGFGRHKLPLSE